MTELDFTKNVAQLMREHPKLSGVLASMGLQCGDCLASQVDTLNDVVRMYKLDAHRLRERLREAHPPSPPEDA